MKAEEVRAHLSSLLVGEQKVITLGTYDTPKAVRNYFLVIAKLEGFIIKTRQQNDNVLVTLLGMRPPEAPVVTEGTNGYYRKNRKQDFNWPVASLQDVEQLMARLDRINLTPKPIVGSDYKSPHRDS